MRRSAVCLLVLAGLAGCASRDPGPNTDNSVGANVARFGQETGRAFGDTTTGAMTTTNRAVGD